MKATIQHTLGNFKVDFDKPIDISIPISANGPRAWYVSEAQISPVINQHFTGSVNLGGAVNFKNIIFNPHGHGTHTESVGHIAREEYSIHNSLSRFFFLAKLVTIEPTKADAKNGYTEPGDSLITIKQIERLLTDSHCEALVVRTLPNGPEKKTKNYSNSNFCYFEEAALSFLAEKNVQHLLVDLPSVDRESDGGLLKAHHAFWKYPYATRSNCTISEFIYVPNEVKDGDFLLNLQVASFINDAAPSRPVLYALL